MVLRWDELVNGKREPTLSPPSITHVLQGLFDLDPQATVLSVDGVGFDFSRARCGIA